MLASPVIRAGPPVRFAAAVGAAVALSLPASAFARDWRGPIDAPRVAIQCCTWLWPGTNVGMMRLLASKTGLAARASTAPDWTSRTNAQPPIAPAALTAFDNSLSVASWMAESSVSVTMMRGLVT